MLFRRAWKRWVKIGEGGADIDPVDWLTPDYPMVADAMVASWLSVCDQFRLESHHGGTADPSSVTIVLS